MELDEISFSEIPFLLAVTSIYELGFQARSYVLSPVRHETTKRSQSGSLILPFADMAIRLCQPNEDGSPSLLDSKVTR